MEADPLEFDFRDQYISVLLELYGTKQEMPVASPIYLGQLKYWQKVVAAFEKFTPDWARSRVRYRASRAETKALSPLQIALVRYAWLAFYTEDESSCEVVRRWENYLDDEPSGEGKTVSYEVFKRKRQFREILAAIRREGLWPWDSI
jgi:hypothetical protein